MLREQKAAASLQQVAKRKPSESQAQAERKLSAS